MDRTNALPCNLYHETEEDSVGLDWSLFDHNLQALRHTSLQTAVRLALTAVQTPPASIKTAKLQKRTN